MQRIESDKKKKDTAVFGEKEVFLGEFSVVGTKI